MDNNSTYDRYRRQIVLKEFGEEGQKKLLEARVLVVGAGGLGCPALQYLAAVGAGTIGIVDYDIVELSNLQRQTLYAVEDIGRKKVEVAAQKLSRFNPQVQFHAHHLKLDTTNALALFGNYDIVLDGTDNFSARYLINDACVLLDKPLVYGAVLRFEGQLGVFNCADKHYRYKTNYRDLFPVPPEPSTVASCSEAGVLGVLPGIIGTMQASEVLKIVTGIGEPLCNKILSYNVLNNLFYDFQVFPLENKAEAYPKNKVEFKNFDYEWFCGVAHSSIEIAVAEFDTLRNQETIHIFDVREKGELPVVNEFLFTPIPMSCFDVSVAEPFIQKSIVVFCQSGKRSLKVAGLIRERFSDCKVFSLKGGIEAWKKYHENTILKTELLSEHERDEETQRIY